MQEDKLIKQLNNLREISPSHDFAERSRSILMSTPRKQTKIWGVTSFRLNIKESTGFALSVGLVAAFIIILLNVTPQTISPLTGANTPTSNNDALLNQANAAVSDIDIHMQEVNSFNAAAEQSSNALNDINPSLLKSENNQISTSTANNTEQNQDIDTVLNELQNPQQYQ